ncbi:MAG: RND family transporter [Halobacteriaceae archaeon]
MVRHEAVVRWVNDRVVEHPLHVVAAFLVVTMVFATGLGAVSTEAGTNQFTEGTPSMQALEDVQREFTPPFDSSPGSTQLIQSGGNVLSKGSLLRMLRAQHRLERRADLRVTSTSSAARIVAMQLDPRARTLEAQIRAVERATPGEIDAAVRRAARSPGFVSLLSNDFNRRGASASATIGVVQHDVPGGTSAMAGGGGGTTPIQRIQVESRHVVDSVGGDFRVFGSGIINDEFSSVIFDSLIIVVPAAVLLILAFLVFAYRDPIDLLLGVVSLVMAVVWTLGFMGLVGIPFTQMLVAVPPLLLAVGIDFGIHSINRYREERALDYEVTEAMQLAVRQLLVAFFIVTGTTVIGFAANLTSSLGPIRDFGVVAAIGIVFTFLIFGVFLPAAKILADHARERVGVPAFGTSPLGEEGSLLGRVLPVGVAVARRAPYLFLAVVLVTSAGAAYYGTGVDTSFAQEDFLPPAEVPGYVQRLPEPFAPNEYTVTATLNYLEDNFASAQQDTVTMYVRGPMRRDYALEAIHRAGRDPPDSFVSRDRHAVSDSLVDVIRSYAAEDPEFARLVARNDRNDNGVPDDNLGQVYEALLDSPYRDRALRYITEDYRSARVVYDVDADATQREIRSDANALADRYRQDATPTGQTIVFQAISDTIFESAIRSLLTALAFTAVFLVFVFWLFDGRWSLGVVNLAPILVSLATLAGAMRYFGVPFNALTATVLSIAIGLGVDYSSHVVHRFADEYDDGDDDVFEALDATVRGTGGALTGSMLTTVTGIGVLVLAITPILGQFGFVTAASILFSYVAALVVTPATVVVWDDVRSALA